MSCQSVRFSEAATPQICGNEVATPSRATPCRAWQGTRMVMVTYGCQWQRPIVGTGVEVGLGGAGGRNTWPPGGAGGLGRSVGSGLRKCHAPAPVYSIPESTPPTTEDGHPRSRLTEGGLGGGPTSDHQLYCGQLMRGIAAAPFTSRPAFSACRGGEGDARDER